MYPTRPAPSTPKNASLPPNHPFATYYIPPYHTNSSSTTLSTSAPSSPSSLRRKRSPTASLAAPLSPRPNVSPIGTRPYTTPYPSSLTHKPSSSLLPTDLAMFDHKSKQTLLGDIETIIGRRLTFPFIEKFTKKSKSTGEKRASRTLKKERDHSWEEQYAWEGVQLLDEKKVSRSGVKEGNWI